MTVETYKRFHNIPYEGKHKKRWYKVSRMFEPDSKFEELKVLGREEAKAMVFGCYEFHITSLEKWEVFY